MSEFNFKSSVCTSKEQSERLLALGLKKETADMCSVIDFVSNNGKTTEEVDTIFAFTPDDWEEFGRPVTPRWSLCRLLRLASYDMEINMFLSRRCFKIFNHKPVRVDSDGALYDGLIDYIEWLIKEGYFNKEYLV